MNALDEARKVNDWVFAVRRELHRHPEKSMEETWTSGKVAEELGKMGLEVKLIPPTGVLGMLRGSSPGKTIALRADIDGLSIQEQTGFDYSSENPGYMHACGHDFHTAMLLGAAKVLSGMKDKLKGNVKFMFQPGEEVALGAKAMIAGGVLEDPKVDMAFGMHVISDVPMGKVVVPAGPVCASGDTWKLTVKGVSAHGSAPWQGVDALVCSAAIVQSLQTLVSRINDARDPIVVNIGTIHGGDRFNIIPGKVEMTGMNRSFSVRAREGMPKWMEEVIKGVCAAHRCQYEFEYTFSCAPLICDTGAAAAASKSVGKIVGAENIIEIPKMMGSEDFSEFSMKVPGSFMILGVGNPAKDCVYSQHSEHYKADEDCIPYGVASHVQVALDFLA